MATPFAHCEEDDLLEAGQADYASGKFADAAQKFESAYQSALRAYGEADRRTLLRLQWLASTQGGLGHYERERVLKEQLLAQSTAVLGSRDELTLSSMNELAQAYSHLGRHVDELALLEKLAPLHAEVLGPEHPETLTTLSNLAAAYRDVGRAAEALVLGQRILDIRIRVLGRGHPHTLSTMGGLASTYRALGRPREQLVINEQVLKLRKAVLGERHPDTLISMSNLALNYGALGRRAEQVALTERELQLHTELHGERHPGTLISMNNLALAYAGAGRLAESLALNERVLALRQEVLGLEHPLTLISMNNLATGLQALGRDDEAVALFERALKVSTARLGESNMDTLRLMGRLAAAYQASERQAEALTLNERATTVSIETLGERHPETFARMLNLASNDVALNRPAQALALDEKVLTLSTEVLGERHPTTLMALANRASAELALGRSAEAIAHDEQALRLRTEVLGDRHPETLESIDDLARALLSVGRLADAAALARRYVEGAEQQRAQPGLSAENRRSLFQRYAVGYRRFSIANGQSGDEAEGFRLAELGKARTLLESMTAQRAARSGILSAAEQASLDDLNRQVAAHNQLMARAPSPEARLELEAARNALAREYEALQSTLKARHPKYAQLSEPRLIDSRHLRGLVPHDAVAVSFVTLADGAVAAWLVDASGRPRFVDLGTLKYLAETVEMLRRAWAHSRGLAGTLAEEGQRAWRLSDGSFRLLEADQPAPDAAVPVADEAEVAAWLSARLLTPLAGSLHGKAKWIVSPDGPLAQLPFELLPWRGRRVLNAAQVHYTQSLSLYALTRARQREYRSLWRPVDLLAMGNPDYGNADPAAITPLRTRLRNASLPGDEAPGSPRFAWPALPGTAKEVEAIRVQWPRSEALLAGQASEARLLQLNLSHALQRYRILHFAVHGNLSTGDPALSSLVLSQTNLAPGTDGYVTAAKWPGYDVHSDLIVLSACETGLGRNVSGEGVMGLPFALFLAGNVNTVLSLWAVDDAATALFMQGFYARLKQGKPAAQALTETKREFAKHPHYRHPRFWAAFVLIGAG